MATVDNKVVSLEFNNSRFTGNVQSTMSALDKLKEKLSFKGAKDGFAEIQANADKVQMNNISRGIEGVSKGFIAMSTIAVTALSKITSSAMATGQKMLNAISFKPLQDGFSEFELNMKSTQTILANTADAGKTLDDVSAALNELNAYSDKTIYNFGQMAENIGKMTAAGVDLDTAVASVKGLSNVAALFGADAQSAAGATYQLSQAMSAGVVKAQDWISVSNANMGGAAFQESLFETGKMMGTLKDVDMGTTFKEWQKDAGGFKGSLEDGWLTTDVLTTTLKGFTGDYTAAQLSAMGYSDEQAQKLADLGKRATASATDVLTFTQLLQVTGEAMGTGWADSFRVVFGDFKETKKLFTNLNGYIGGIIGRSADARNKVLKDWRKGKGRETLMQGFLYAWEDILSILKPVQEAFRNVFPKKTGADLLSYTKRFRDFFMNFKIGEGTVTLIRGVFTAFFGAIKLGFKILTGVAGVIAKVVSAIVSFASALAQAGGGAITSFFSAIGDLFSMLTGGAGAAASGALDGISSGAAKLGTWLGSLLSNLAGVTQKIKDFTASLRGGEEATGSAEKSTSRFAGVIEWLKNAFTGVKDFFKGIFEGVSNFGQGIGNIFSKIVDGLSSIGEGIMNALKDAFGGFKWTTLIGGIGVGAGVVLVKRIKDFMDKVDIVEIIDTLKTKLMGVLDSVSKTLNSFSMSLKADALKKVAVAIAIFALSILLLASIKPALLLGATAAIGALFVALNKSMKNLDTIGSDMTRVAGTMVGLALALLLLSYAVKTMGSMANNGDIAAGVTGVSLLMAGVTVAAKQIKKDTGDLAKAGLAMVGMSVAIYILTFAIERLTKLDPLKALAGVGAAIAAIIGMAQALKMIDEKSAKVKGFAFLSVGIAVNLFAMAVEKFGNMPLDKLGTGMAAIAAIFTGLVFFFKALPPDVAAIAMEILVISIAMNIFARAVEAMGSMKWDTMKQGLIGIAAALILMAIAAQVMNSAIVGAGAIVIMAVGLTLLAGAVATFGQMGVDTMIKSLLGIAAVLVIIAAAGALMGFIAPLLLAGGIAFTVLGLGMLLFGAGAWLVASAIVALAASSGAGVAAAVLYMKVLAAAIPGFIAAFAKGFIDGVKEILDAIPGLMSSASKALYSVFTMLIKLIAKVIHDNIDSVVQAGIDLILGFLRGIRDNVGKVIDTAIEVLLAYVNGIADAVDEHAQEIGEAGRRLAMSLVAGIVKALVPKAILDQIGDLVNMMIDWFKNLLGIHSPSSVFMDLAGNIIEGLWQGLTTAVPKVLKFFLELPGKIIEGLGNLLETLVPKGLELLGGLLKGILQKWIELQKFWITLPFKILEFLVNAATTLIPKGVAFLAGLLTGFVQKLPEIGRWLGALPGKVVGFIGNVIRTLWRKGSDLLQGLKNGIMNKYEQVKTWVAAIPGKLVSSLSNIGQKLVQKGRDLIQGLWDGIKNKWNQIVEWVKKKSGDLVDTITHPWKIFSPSRVMREKGEYLIEGLRVGMADSWKTLESESKVNASSLLTAVQDASKAAMDAALVDGMNPTIRPVLDLSLVEEKARTLGDMLGIDSLATDMSYIKAQQIATTADDASSATDAVGGGDTYLNFVQNNNSPKALSTGDIYRGQKSQIALAKKELGLAS